MTDIINAIIKNNRNFSIEVRARLILDTIKAAAKNNPKLKSTNPTVQNIIKKVQDEQHRAKIRRA